MNILVSVSDRSGLVEFLGKIKDHITSIYATGGTNRFLHDNGIDSSGTSELTGVEELLGGRVKTLHPAIFSGILSRRTDSDNSELNSANYPTIDMVIANFYPFHRVADGHNLTDMIENIDIGGVSLVRAAAKNFKHVTVLSDPSDYQQTASEITSSGSVSENTRKKLALKTFSIVSAYDSMIYGSLSRLTDPEGENDLTLHYTFSKSLRYGENPDQKAALYALNPQTGIASSFKMSGKDLSYNNYLDMDAAYRTVLEFSEPACVIVKHLTPCGASVSPKLRDAFIKAYNADSESAYGSVIAFNRNLDEETANEMIGHFIEVVIAPGYDGQSFDILRKKKKNLRILRAPSINTDRVERRSISGGMLVQDYMDTSLDKVKPQTSKTASQDQLRDLEFAWKISAYCKSNSIVIAKDGTTLGIGAGQTSRVRAMKIALDLAGEKTRGAVVASDGFFPFKDSIELASRHGISAVIEPGGSIRDEEVISEAEKSGIILYFAGKRVFRH